MGRLNDQSTLIQKNNLGVNSMFNKKILVAAITTAVMSTSAFAAQDLDATAPAAAGNAIATQSLITTGKVTVSATDHFVITDGAATDFPVTSTVGLGLAADTPIYVRYDLTNAVFNTAVTAANIAVDDSSGAGNAVETLSQGGTQGSSFVVYGATPSAGNSIQIASDVVFSPVDLAITGVAGATISASLYLDINDAVNSTNSFKTLTMANYVQTVDGLVVTSTQNTPTAEVEDDFKKFVATDSGVVSALIAETGSVVVTATPAIAEDDGSALALADMITEATSAVVITGDFSSGTWGIDTGAGNCAGTLTAGVLNTGKTTLTTTLAALNAEETLCNVQTGAVVVPESPYSASVTYTPVANAAFPATTASAELGEVDHNGTTVQIPYLTTFSGYNQRLVVVNRGANDVSYSISFTAEDGVTAVAGTAANGTLGANSTSIINASDIVTLTGKTRTAATLTVVSPQASIDVATTQVNLADSGTDTVKLK